MKKSNNLLIVGIGNNTREDDGLGWNFLDLLKTKGFKEEQLVYKYQLMVEDAELISHYKKVFFVDACKSDLQHGFSIEKLAPSNQVAFSTHSVPPNQILNLCETIYNHFPESYVIKIKGVQWDYHIGLSTEAEDNLKNAFLEFTENYV